MILMPIMSDSPLLKRYDEGSSDWMLGPQNIAMRCLEMKLQRDVGKQ